MGSFHIAGGLRYDVAFLCPRPTIIRLALSRRLERPFAGSGATLVFKRDWGSGVKGSPLAHRCVVVVACNAIIECEPYGVVFFCVSVFGVVLVLLGYTAVVLALHELSATVNVELSTVRQCFGICGAQLFLWAL